MRRPGAARGPEELSYAARSGNLPAGRQARPTRSRDISQAEAGGYRLQHSLDDRQRKTKIGIFGTFR